MNNLFTHTIGSADEIQSTVTYESLYEFTVEDSVVPQQKKEYYTELIVFFSPLPKNNTLLKNSQYPELVQSFVDFLIKNETKYTMDTVVRALNELTLEITDMDRNSYKQKPNYDEQITSFLVEQFKQNNFPDFMICLLQAGLFQLDYMIRSSQQYRLNTDKFRPLKEDNKPDSISPTKENLAENKYNDIPTFGAITEEKLVKELSTHIPATIATYRPFDQYMIRVIKYIFSTDNPTNKKPFISKTQVVSEFEKVFTNANDKIPRLTRILSQSPIEYSYVLYFYLQIFAHYDDTEAYRLEWLENDSNNNDNNSNSDFRIT